MIQRQAEKGQPVSCLINNPFIPWVLMLLRVLGIPSAMLWVQSSVCFSAYYHYFNKLVPFPSEQEPEIDVQNKCGPCGSFVADSCSEWLDSKTPQSVVYISFGSIVHLKQEQVDEIAHGLLGSEVSFLWVVRPPPKELNVEPHVLPQGFLEKAGDKGKIVKWSPQEQVLAHPSTACFVTHCGWNSAMEALASGVPVVAFPQWGDQVTNAKFLVDVLKVGIRLGKGEAEGKIVPRDEVERCFRTATEESGGRGCSGRWFIL
ncbi:UNVERIFIED_CONTAM: Gallate 1-beta-glucosyltransferase [Sesamum angustifolium]|uniref:Gallate 1-beta-glucosyltransferase n=1 Tax=Sesamum angustifolium TaxID=2727405 RepID=A0AAW2PWI1_9LAMI